MTTAKRTLAAATIAFSLTSFSRAAVGQQTDDHWLAALGFVPFTVQSDSWHQRSRPTQRSSAWRAGLGGESILQVGRGVGPLVIGLDVGFGIAEETHEQVDITSSASIDRIEVSSVEVGLGPNVRYLFVEGGVRPFVEVGGGVAWLHGEQVTYELDLTRFYAHLGPGVQLQIIEVVSLDVIARVGYAYGFGESALSLMIASGGLVTGFDTNSDVYEHTLELALHVRLSIWL